MFFVADAHCDTLYARAIGHTPAGACMITPERLREGGVGLQMFAMFAGAEGPGGRPAHKLRDQLAMAAQLGVPVYTGLLPDAPPEEPAGALSIEGGEVLEGSLERLGEICQQAYIRLLALTWNHENEIGYPAKMGGDLPLKPFGRRLIGEMDRLGVLVDVSHLGEGGFWEVMERAQLPPVASHSNLKELCGHARNLTRRQVRALIERGGYIGINFYSRFLVDAGEATLDDVVRHIDEIAQMGGIGVLGFGSDFDGIDEWPQGLEGPHRFPELLDRLAARGYTAEQLAALAGGNLWNLLKRAERARV